MIITLETPNEVLGRIALSIKAVRLQNGYRTQKEQALSAGIPFSTYVKMEQKGKGSLEDFVKVVMSLGRGYEFERILQIEEEDLIRKYEKQNKVKKRICKKQNEENQ